MLQRLINEKLLAIAMTYRCKTDEFRYVAAGRSELGRDGAKHEQLASEYSCGSVTLTRFTKQFRANHNCFRKLAIEAAGQLYKEKGIQVSAGSVRAYLMRRRRKYGNFDFESAEQSPPDFHEIVSPVFKHRELWIPDSIWCNLNNGRQPR